MAESHCRCWNPGPLVTHEGHCCFREGAVDDYAPGKVLPCGHVEPEGWEP